MVITTVLRQMRNGSGNIPGIRDAYGIHFIKYETSVRRDSLEDDIDH